MSVVDAGVITMKDDHILDTFHVLEANDRPVTGDARMTEIQVTLTHAINGDTDPSWHVSRRLPRQYRHFPIKTHIAFRQDEDDQRAEEGGQCKALASARAARALPHQISSSMKIPAGINSDQTLEGTSIRWVVEYGPA